MRGNSRQVRARDAGETEYGHHEDDKGAGHDADGHAVPAEVPWSSAEAVAYEEDTDEDGQCES